MTKARLLSLALILMPLAQAEAASIVAAERAIQSKDFSKALDELRPLAKDGDPNAYYLLGTLYRDGQGVEKNRAEAEKYFGSAARQGHLDSVKALRAMKNEVYLLEYNKTLPLAEQGDANAQNRIGEMNEYGQGVKRDLESAFNWYQKASKQGLLAGRHNLARSYNFGSGTTQDFAKAESLYLEAANQGYADSMFFLGTMYATHNGQNKQTNPDILAYAWMHAASEAGSATARTIQDRLLMKLNDSELTEAKHLADEFVGKYVKR